MERPETICHFRLTGAESSYCLMKTRRMADTENAIPSLVFHSGDESRPILCGPDLAAICPFRSAGSGRPSKLPMLPCPHCGHRHRADSNSRMICEAWASIKQVLKQMRTDFPGIRKYYLIGTRQLPTPRTRPTWYAGYCGPGSNRPYSDETSIFVRIVASTSNAAASRSMIRPSGEVRVGTVTNRSRYITSFHVPVGVPITRGI